MNIHMIVYSQEFFLYFSETAKLQNNDASQIMEKITVMLTLYFIKKRIKANL